MGAPTVRSLAAGVCAGVILSAARPPLGLDLLHLPAVGGGTAALFGAVPWILLAGLLGRTARRFAGGVPVLALLTGAALGFALHACVLVALVRPETRLGMAAALSVPAVLLFLCVRGKSAEPGPEADTPRPAERLALFVAGAGLALALQPLAYHLQHLGMASEAEASVRGVVFATLLALGAAAFGPPLARGRAAPAALAGGLAVAAALALLGATLLQGLAEQRALDSYLRRFGVDFTMIGTLRPTLLLAGVLYVAPGLCAGAALAGARHPARLAAVLLGAGAGVGLWPFLVDLALDAPRAAAELHALDAPAWTWRWVATGVWVASAGGAAAALLGARGKGRAVALCAAAAAALAPLAAPRKPVWILSPWHRITVEPALTWNTGDGLFTVESERGGALVLTLDRRRLTPLAEEEQQDAERFDDAWRLLAPQVRASGAVRVLYAGQLTPPRAFALRAYPGLRLDHTVPWHAHRGPLDAALFGGEAVPGRALSPEAAREHLAAGDYDLVFAPPTHGPLVFPRSAALIPFGPAPAPATAGWRVPAGTLAVAWIEASAPLSGGALQGRALLSSRGVYDFDVGLVLGNAAGAGERDAPRLLDTGGRRRGAWPLCALARRPAARGFAASAALFERLADANQPAQDLLRGLARFASIQRESSPFESLDVQTEIDEEALALLHGAAAQGLDPFQRRLWEGLARLLSGKRMPAEVRTYVEPLAEAHAPWPVLERCVATAYQEFTMTEEAARWLQRAAQSAPYDIGLKVEAAEWTGRAGDSAGEVRLLREADALQPGRLDLERLLAIALLRAGDPDGRARVEALLAEHPEDAELADLLKSGPAPRPEALPPGLHGEHGPDENGEPHR